MPEMNEIAAFEWILWGFSLFLDGMLLVLLLYYKNHRVFPAFFVYILFNLLQGLVLIWSYLFSGFSSPLSIRIAWGTQAVVVAARALAVALICERVLVRYRGVWALAKRLLVATAAVVLLCSWAVASGSWQFALLNANRGLALAIASAIVTLFAFARYYGVAVEPAVRTLAIGFFLYCCFLVLNDTILERLMYDYTSLWNLLETLAFLASLLLWTWVLRAPLPATPPELQLLPAGIYNAVSPEINERLRALNDHLENFWKVGRNRS